MAPAPRRIVPQLISPSQAVAAAKPVFLEAPTQQVQKSLDLREQAAIAKEKLPPGRRIYVDLSVSRDVSWHQLLKAQGVSSKDMGSAPADSVASAEGTGGRVNVFANVIARLEAAYVTHNDDDDEDSESEEEERPRTPPAAAIDSDDPEADAAVEDGAAEDAGAPPPVAGRVGEAAGQAGEAAQPDDAAGPSNAAPAPAAKGEKDRKLGAQLDDHYDYEDDFIDDSEFVEYYEGGDRRKAKYSGFFINKGTVEKTGEMPVILPSPPKRKRKKPARPGDEDDDGAVNLAAQKKRKVNGDGTKQRKVMRMADGQLVSGAADADAKAPASARKSKGGGAGGYEMAPELRKVVDAMRAAVAELPPPPEDDKKQGLPQVIKDLLPALAGHLTRDMRRNRTGRVGAAGVRSALLTEAMTFLEPWILRNNFNSAIKRHQEKDARKFKEVRSDLLEAIHAKLPPGIVLPRTSDAAATGEAAEAALINGGGGDESPSGQAPMYAPVTAGQFTWDSEVEERFARFVSVRISYLGGSTTGERGEKLFQDLCNLWPPDSVSADALRKVYTNRKRAQTKAVNQARKEQEAAANAGQQQPGQLPASNGPPVAMPSHPSAAPSPMGFASQPPEGPPTLSSNAGASQPALGQQQQQQQQYGGMMLPPAGSSLYPAQQQHSNDAAAHMQMAPREAAATYAVPQPQSAAFPMPVSQPQQLGTLPQPAAYGTVPQPVPYGMVPQGVPYGSPQPGAAYQMQPPQYAQQQQQQQQPQVLNLRPLPGQSMADAAMAAIQAQQAQMQQQQQLQPQQQNGLATGQQLYMQAAQQAQRVAAASAPASGLKPTAGREQSVTLSQQHTNGTQPAVPPERQESGLSQQQPGPASLGPLLPVNAEDHISAGVARGAPREELQASVAEFGTSSTRAVINLVLMHAGPEGFMVRDIIQKAADLRIVDWEGSKGKKSHISGCIGKERRFVHVGGWKYTLQCFPGAKEAPRREGSTGGAKAKASGGASIQQFFAGNQSNPATQPDSVLDGTPG